MIIRQKKQRYLFEENYYFIIHRLVRKWYWLVRCYVNLSNNNVNWKARIERENGKCWMFDPLTTKEKKNILKIKGKTRILIYSNLQNREMEIFKKTGRYKVHPLTSPFRCCITVFDNPALEHGYVLTRSFGDKASMLNSFWVSKFALLFFLSVFWFCFRFHFFVL